MAAASNKKKFPKEKAKDATKLNKATKKPFKAKPKKQFNDAVQAGATSTFHLEDDVPDFPRGGGGSSLSQKERDQIRAEVDAEFESGERVWRTKKKNNQKIKGKQSRVRSNFATGEDDLGSLFGDGITGKLPRFANKITLRNISPGMKLWGVIVEVNEKDLVISLPGGLRGLVRWADAFDHVLDTEIEGSDVLPSKFHVGQLVSCVVSELDDDKKENSKRKIWLSLRLSLLHKGFSLDSIQEGMLLTAYVKSIEDHGFILHFGLPSFMGFLPKNKQPDGRDGNVKAGQLLQGVVRTIDKIRKVVYLSSDPDTVSKCVIKDVKGMSIDLLVPGMMVHARVQSTLENGVMLSFLTYFTGTVDIVHLQNALPISSWKDDYSKNKKVNARVLFIDPSTRAVGLTLNLYLVHNKAPPCHVRIGDIYECAKVARVDVGSGLLLELPSAPVSTPAYVGISDITDDEVRKLEKQFKEGRQVRLRVLGFRHLEGIATGTLKASAFEGPMLTHSDVKPGMVVRAKVIAVNSFGAIVQFPGGLKALCPLRHMSEFEISKPRKKFKVGAELVYRVLGCKSKRITVTHKKALVKSKLPILSSYADATDGLITHGWITKIEPHGCFVHFYNGVQGFAPRSELGLEPGSDSSSIYHIGQVVKCRVMNSVPASRRINLSFVMKPVRVSEEDAVRLGSVVSGVVEKVTHFAVIVRIRSKSYLKGTLSTEHLADHHEHAILMKSVLKPGYEFEQLLVLDIENNNLILSAKYSLINSANELPSDLSHVHPGKIVHGYICNLIDTGCFIRFLGRLTGFSPRSKAMDDQRVQLSEAFYIGQSVRTHINDVNNETTRITLSLKQSLCASTDASFLKEFFLLDEKIAKLQSSDSKGEDLKWVEEFDVGRVIKGKILESKEVGVVVSFDKYADVFGFISHYQLGGSHVKTGSIVCAVVLDVVMTERLVDLSLKPELLEKANTNSQTYKKKRRREDSNDLEVHQTVTAIVEIIKDSYLVLTIPKHNHAIGYASVFDYNVQKLPHKHFMNGQSVIATVMDLPSPSSSGRLILSLKSIADKTETSSSKKAKKKSTYTVGSVVETEITELKPLEMRVKFGIGFRGRIHITEVDDTSVLEDPFGKFKVGQTITARIVAKASQSDNRKSGLWELTIKPKMLSGSTELGDNLISEETEFSVGQCITGYVYKVDSQWAWLAISRHVKGQLFILDTSCEPSELHEFHRLFYVGKAVKGYVLSNNQEKKLLRLVLRPIAVLSRGKIDGKALSGDVAESGFLHDGPAAYIHEGDMIGGRVNKVLAGVGGLLVQIGPHVHGRVHFTELRDSWVPDPLCGYLEGQFVKCKVLEINRSVKGTIHVDLSLCLSSDVMTAHNSREASENLDTLSRRLERIEDLHVDMAVQGYVKNVTSRGCFISLSRKLDAKILLSNLSDRYIDNLEEEFPIGKLVSGRVLSVEPLSKRVEVSLRELSSSNVLKSKIIDFTRFRVGDIISGTVKRVESYGLFIRIDHTNMVGLCHSSELSEDHIDNIETVYRAGEKVVAKILKVDEERHRISLGMKNLGGINGDELLPVKAKEPESNGEHDLSDDDDSNEMDSLGSQIMESELVNDEYPAFPQAESRASIPPLEVTLDDMGFQLTDSPSRCNQENIGSAIINERDEKQATKIAREQREREIKAAEDRLLEKDMPRSVDEFEKVIHSSPNSSFIWIKYMAFMLSSYDVQKARSIAERALRTINVREENEKLNMWVAYFNLENEYGNPKEEAVEKLFERALQVSDQKKLYLALLGMYERTEQHKLVNELLDKMVKKFKHSCKVWLKRLESIIKQRQDGVQSMVNRALLSLPRHKHIKFISQAAILEFKCGIPDRGRSMFEGMLREYPKRTDLWSVYLDQEIRLGDVDVTRSLFERTISLSLPPKKMKFLFKKYLEYEKLNGDEEKIESVKRKAMEYVENTLS